MTREVIIYDVDNLPFGSKIKVDGLKSIKIINDIAIENGMKYKENQKVTLGW